MQNKPNSPFKNMLVVWHALFLRQLLDRWFGSRAGWAWQIIEPCIHIGFMAVIFGVIRARSMGAVDFMVWFSVGIFAFFMFMRTGTQTMHALDCNRAFFAFRMVRPFDAALMRGFAEGFSMTIAVMVLLCLGAMCGKDVVPNDTLMVMGGFFGMWFFGVGWGLVTSVCMRLVQDLGHIFQLAMMPLYVLSGVFMGPGTLPEPYRSMLMHNPLAHGLEIVRQGFISAYHGADASLAYLLFSGFILWAVGLALYKLLETRLVMS